MPRDLDRLCVDLLRLDPELRPRGREVLARLADAPRPRRLTLPPELEVRRRELGLLHAMVRRAREGHVGAACLHGPTGVGKSAMLRHTASVAALDASNAVVSVRCVIDEVDHADTAALCVLRGLIRHTRPPPFALLLAARDPSALGLPRRVHRIEVTDEDTIPDDDVPTEELPAEG